MDYEMIFWIVALILCVGFVGFLLLTNNDVYVSDKKLKELNNNRINYL